MPTKHQSDCYRTFAGTRYPNLMDVLEPVDVLELRDMKALGLRIRQIKHPDGYHQAFIHPDDLEKVATYYESRGEPK